MYNTFVWEKKQREKQLEEERRKKEESIKARQSEKNSKLRDIFEKKLDKIIEYKLVNPLPEINNFVLNETFFLERNQIKYKTNTTGILGPPCFRMTFNASEKQRIASAIEKNKILSTEYTPKKPHQFRDRVKAKDINPPMRFARPDIPPLRSKSVSHSRPNNTALNISQAKNSIMKETIAEARKTVKFADKSQNEEEDDDIEFPAVVSSIISDSSDVHVTGIERKSPFKSLQQYANNRKENTYLADNTFYLQKVQEVYYPKDKPPKRRIVFFEKRTNAKDSDSSDNEGPEYDYDVDSDAGSIDDVMLEGDAQVAKKKRIDKRNLDKVIIHNHVRKGFAKDVLSKANAVKQLNTTVDMPRTTFVLSGL